MKLYHRNDYIVRFADGNLWHFFFKKGQGIYFRPMKTEGIWGNDVELITQVHEDFSVNIDSQNFIHLICQGNNGEINYMKYNGKTWAKQLLFRYEPSRYIVRFPSIIVLDKRIHILFIVGTAFNIGIWVLYHYFWDGKEWIKNEITKYTAGKQVSPFHFDVDGKNIHLIYRSLYPNQYQIFHCRFDDNYTRWSTPEKITHSLNDCIMPDILIKDNKLHLVWTSIENANLQVKYLNKNLAPYSRTSWEKELILSNEGSNCSYPQLFWVDNRLWCIWYQNNDLYYCASQDQGVTWESVKSIEWSHLLYCYYIKYCTNLPEEHATFKMQRIFANLDNGIEFPILGKYMDLPKPVITSQQIASEIIQKVPEPPAEKLKSIISEPSDRSNEQTDLISHTKDLINDLPEINQEQSKLPVDRSFEDKEKSQYNEIPRDHIAAHIKVLLNELDKINNVKNRLQLLIDKNNSEIDSMSNCIQLEELLDLWIKKAEKIQIQNQMVMREIEELRRQTIENQRQWEILLAEFEDVKHTFDKTLNKGFLKKIFEAFNKTV